MRDNRRRCVAQVGVYHQRDLIGRKHLNRRGQRRFRQGVGIHAHEQRATNALFAPHFGNGLAHGQDMVLVKGLL